MASNQKITRSEHVASIALPPGRVAQVLGKLQRSDVLIRIGLCVAAALLIWLITSGWKPPFGYRAGYTPKRNIDARVAFRVPDEELTRQRREEKRSVVECVYRHDAKSLRELQRGLTNSLFGVMGAASYDELNKEVWKDFLSKVDKQPAIDDKAVFARARAALAGDTELTQFSRAVQRALQPFDETGLIDKLAHLPGKGSQQWIKIYTPAAPDDYERVEVRDVHIPEVTADFQKRLRDEFGRAGFAEEHVEDLCALAFNYCINIGLPTTLTQDIDATQREYDRELVKVVGVRPIAQGEMIVRGGTSLDVESLSLLRAEYNAVTSKMTPANKLGYSLASFGMYGSVFLLCGVFIFFHRPQIIAKLRRLVTLLAALVTTVILGRLCSGVLWQAEVVPIVLFGMTIAIAYSRDLALILSTAVSLMLCVALGMGLAEFVLMVATGSAAIILLNRVRSRTKLIYVGLGAAAVAILTTICIGTLLGQPLGSWSGTKITALDTWQNPKTTFLFHLSAGAVWHGVCAILASLIMTGILPFIERLFDVQTDISLLELGDAAHPLLQELARRAPGTYNHSINVASLAEAAADK